MESRLSTTRNLSPTSAILMKTALKMMKISGYSIDPPESEILR